VTGSQESLQLENTQLKEQIHQLKEVVAKWKRLSNELYAACARLLSQGGPPPPPLSMPNDE